MRALTVFLLWSGIGWIMLFLGLSVRRSEREQAERERTRAAGTIVAHVKHLSDDRRREAAAPVPVVCFRAEGREIRSEAKKAPASRYPVGREVDVLYDPDDPTRFHFEEDKSTRAIQPLILIGLIWILIAAVATCILAAAAGEGPDFTLLYHRFRLFLWRLGIRPH